MKKRLILGVVTSFLLIGAVGCSNDKPSNDKKMSSKESQQMNGKKMNMSSKEMKNMKTSDNK